VVAIEPKTRVETTQIGIFEILLRDPVMIDKIMNNIVLVFAPGEAAALAQGSDGIPHDGLTLEARRGGVGVHGRENCPVGLCFDFLSKREVEESIGRPAPRACWGPTMGRVQGLWYFIAVAGTSGGQGPQAPEYKGWHAAVSGLRIPNRELQDGTRTGRVREARQL